MKAIIVYKCH